MSRLQAVAAVCSDMRRHSWPDRIAVARKFRFEVRFKQACNAPWPEMAS